MNQQLLHKQRVVTEAQKQEYNKKGHILIKGVTSPQQFSLFRQHMMDAINKVKQKGDKQQRIDDYSNIFTQVTNIWRLDPVAAQFILCKKFGQIAADLLGVSKVRIYHDQALVKFAKSAKTPWHQDYFYWPIDSPKTITMWLPLHSCPRTNGTMEFVTGSHKDQSIDPQPIREGSQQYYQKMIKQNNLEVQTYDLEVGDATFHSGRTIHCAHPNVQMSQRQVITIIYFEDGAAAMPQQKFNEFRKVDLKVFCPGIKASQKIESQLNPIIN